MSSATASLTTVDDESVGGSPRRSSKSSPALRTLGRIVRPSIVVVAFLILWEFAAAQEWIEPSFPSRPSDVWTALIDFAVSGRLWTQTLATMQAVVISFIIGTVLGTALGFAIGVFPGLDRWIGALLVPLNSIPRIALAPLFILWFGLTMTSKVMLAVSIVFFMLLFNARAAVKSVDTDHMVLSRVLGLSKAAVLAKVVFPSAVPSIFAGVRLAITYSLLGVITSEMIAAQDGLGQDIVYFSSRLQIGGVWAVLLVLAILATLINVGFDALESRLLRWQAR